MISRAGAIYQRFREQARAANSSADRRRAQALLARHFSRQRDFITDPWRRKCLLCPRRAGKSYAAAGYLFYVALTVPGANCVFVTLTRLRAKKILWRLLKRLDKEFELGCTFNETELSVFFDNGSIVSLAGCETQADIDKFRGEAFHLFLIDETKSFPPELLNELIEDAVEPALSDYLGTLGIMGTPGSVLVGLFYEATGPTADKVVTDEDTGKFRATSRRYAARDEEQWLAVQWEWSFHSWTVADNEAKPHIWLECLALKARKGWTDQNPKWIREYLGRWIADNGELVYAYSVERCSWKPGAKTPSNPFGLPDGHDWHYILGVDLGFVRAFALQVAAYSDTHRNFYQVYEYVAPGLHAALMAEAIKKAEAMVPGGFVAMVGDHGALGGQIFDTLAKEHGVVVEPAKKKDKRDHIELLNSDLIDGRCKILPTSQLAKEMSELVWEDANKKREAEGMANDACDAWLYIRVRAGHHFAAEIIPPPEPGTPEHAAAYEAEELRKMEEAEARKWSPEGDAVEYEESSNWSMESW